MPKDDSKTTTRILSQVETFRRAALVRPPSSPPGEAAEVQDVIGYGIESVFTVEARRGRGYATYMMRMLHCKSFALGSETMRGTGCGRDVSKGLKRLADDALTLSF